MIEVRFCGGRRAAVLLAGASLVAGCAARRMPPDAPPDRISGRLAIRIAADGNQVERGVSVGFELDGSPRSGSVEFTSPLGSLVARAQWSAQQVLLVTSQGERRFADLDSMSREVLGETIPLAALFDWLRGRPWPGETAQDLSQGKGFAQLGWRVDLTRFEESVVIASRATAPEVTVRAVVDRR